MLKASLCERDQTSLLSSGLLVCFSGTPGSVDTLGSLACLPTSALSGVRVLWLVCLLRSHALVFLLSLFNVSHFPALGVVLSLLPVAFSHASNL